MARTTIGLLRALTELNLRVLRDVSLTIFNGVDLGQFAKRAPMTVRQYGYLFGRAIVRRLLALIHEEPCEENRIVLPAQLIIRGPAVPPSSARSRAGTLAAFRPINDAT